MGNRMRSTGSKLPRGSAWLALLGIAITSTAAAGPVKGKVAGVEKLMPDVYAEALKPEAHAFSWREPSPTVKKEFRDLTANPSRDVCIAAVSPNPAPKHDPIMIVLTGGHTIPSTIVIAPGAVLTIANHDPFSHRLYQVGSESFKADELQSGKSRDWVAPGQGRFEFRDQASPSVRFTVVVEPGVVDVVYPARNGSFAFRDLAPGDYYLKAYFNGKQVGKQVTVVASKGTVELKEAVNVAEAVAP